jgi:hypothetical protein
MFLVAGCYPRPADVTEDGAIEDAAEDAAPDAPSDAALDAPPDTPGTCNPLTQTGCAPGNKCTWMLDALMPMYMGHVGCVPDGSADVGVACNFGAPGATGYDNCKKGLVCSNYRGGAGTCKTICDLQGGSPSCSPSQGCADYSGLFAGTQLTPTIAGVCDPACDPLSDNDFDGSGSLTRSTSTCGSATVGCYGYPSYGTPPKTTWLCQNDINFDAAQPIGLRHRVVCSVANNCADPGPMFYPNSCNQGYLPLLYEQTGSSNIICVAMCKPANCYAGNCGVNNANRLGVAPHRCMTPDRVGTFNTAAGGEHCRYLWRYEVDDSNNYLPSSTSNAVGFCVDHSKYKYDSNGDAKLDTQDLPYPACSTLQITKTGNDPTNPTTYFGAKDLGCVDSTTAGNAWGKPAPLRSIGTRALYRPQTQIR